MSVVKTCGGGKSCTLDEGHAGPCVQQRPCRGAGGSGGGGGRDLASTPSWVREDWGDVTTPEVWERKGWRD